jgi:hypothetical protein
VSDIKSSEVEEGLTHMAPFPPAFRFIFSSSLFRIFYRFKKDGKPQIIWGNGKSRLDKKKEITPKMTFDESVPRPHLIRVALGLQSEQTILG